MGRRNVTRYGMAFPIETLQQVQGFFWIFLRVGVLFFLLPFFGARNIPTLWKAGLTVVTSLVLFPVVPPPPAFPQTILEVIMGIASEVLMGFVLALGVKMLLAAVELAGQFMGFQMGFNMASAMDPETGGQSTVISQFLYLFTVLIFFSVNGHHMFIRALAASFYKVPPDSFHLNAPLVGALVKVSSEMFVIALKMAAPIMVALFLSNVCLGVVARTVPQVNVLMIGLPLNIFLGMILFSMVLLNLSPLLEDLVHKIGEALLGMLQMM
jgi:flagellar biosynthetic protein FliR